MTHTELIILILGLILVVFGVDGLVKLMNTVGLIFGVILLLGFVGAFLL